jgi:hypothetical protein
MAATYAVPVIELHRRRYAGVTRTLLVASYVAAQCAAAPSAFGIDRAKRDGAVLPQCGGGPPENRLTERSESAP